MLAGTLSTFGLLILLRERITNGQPDRLRTGDEGAFLGTGKRWARLVAEVSTVCNARDDAIRHRRVRRAAACLPGVLVGRRDRRADLLDLPRRGVATAPLAWPRRATAADWPEPPESVDSRSTDYSIRREATTIQSECHHASLLRAVLSIGLLTSISHAQFPREITFDDIARPKPGEWPSYNGLLSAIVTARSIKSTPRLSRSSSRNGRMRWAAHAPFR